VNGYIVTSLYRRLNLDSRSSIHVIVTFVTLLVLGKDSVALEVSTSGYGAPTSVSVERSTIARAALPPRNWIDQTQREADAKSIGCLQCHQGVEPMHKAEYVVLGCIDCHGGNPARGLTKEQAHILPRNKEFWKTSANPPDSNAWLNHESPEFIRFINPGDLRVAQQSCGLCHGEIIRNVDHSMMNHGAMLWGAALYNNGSFYLKNYRFGQAYGADGAPLRLVNYAPVTPEDTRVHGILPFIEPLQRFNLSNPGNILRIFEKGGEKQLQLGLPTSDEPNGRPRNRLSERGLGTLNRTDPVFLGLQKTRLHDPLLGFLGSNDHPGDYRRAVARPVTSFTPTIGHQQLRVVEQIRTSGSQFHCRSNDPENGERTSDHPSIHSLDSV
jgi:hypothetical protein